MPPYSFKFHHTSPMDMYDLRQQLADLHLGILHCIEVTPPYVVVHYANFTKEIIREEIETKGKLIHNWVFIPLEKN